MVDRSIASHRIPRSFPSDHFFRSIVHRFYVMYDIVRMEPKEFRMSDRFLSPDFLTSNPAVLRLGRASV